MDKSEFQEVVEELSSYRGRHTELVTVLVPAGFNLNTISKQLEAEKSTADNIKSASTRKNVVEALEKIIRELKLATKTPEHGVALFCGNISQNEGQTDIRLWAIEPIKPLKVRLYRCDQVFVTEPLKEMLEVDEIYGLVVIERKEATLGLLEGKNIKVVKHMTSGVPGKYKTGGQCLSKDTLIMKEDGDIIEIKDAHNPCVIVAENFNIEKSEETPIITKWQNKKQLFKITTCYPKIEIKSSLDHLFFVRTENGIEEKPLSEIKKGDFLIMPEKINLTLPYQKLEFIPKIESTRNLKEIKIPELINEEFAKILGYYLGDGSYELDRLTFFEQRESLARYYKNLLEKLFSIETKLSFRKSKNYWQIRIYSRIISQLFKQIFPEKDKTMNEKIPTIILKSPDNVLASFISGFFDAEGYITKKRIGLGINNQRIVKQLQFVLLRLGIISSIWEYDNRKNPYSKKVRYTLSIEDIDSIKNFKDAIGFNSDDKRKKLEETIKNRSNRNKVRQIVINGKDVARIIRNSGFITYKFNCPDFFNNQKQLNKQLFKERVIDKIENEELKRRLMFFYNSNLIAVKIAGIEQLNPQETIDIETKSHNFLANCLVVHNSAQRFERLREGIAKEFFRRVADDVKKAFFDIKKLKGILVGGPGPTKEDFLAEGQLVTALKNKVIAVKDIGYSDEHGLKLLVESAKEELKEQGIIKEKQILEKFFNTLGKNPDKIAYGLENVKAALKAGAVEKILVSEKLKKEPGTKEEIKRIERAASETSADVVFISNETNEGLQFENLSGLGAFLRYAFK